MPLLKLFKDHPESIGETYVQHMRAALGFSFTMCRAAACCAVHAFLPFLFEKTGSSTVEQLSRSMMRGHRVRKREATRIESDLCI